MKIYIKKVIKCKKKIVYICKMNNNIVVRFDNVCFIFVKNKVVYVISLWKVIWELKGI